MSTRPIPAPIPKCSSRIQTPRSTATAGLTYVTTVALDAPAFEITYTKSTSPSAVQTMPRIATELRADAEGITLEAVRIAGIRRTSEPTAVLADTTPSG